MITSIPVKARHAQEGIALLRSRLLHYGEVLKTDKWQGMDAPPEFLEILHASMTTPMPATMDKAEQFCRTSPQGWAEEHFKERVSGIPYNPPPSHTKWLKGNEDSMDNGIFNHTYPERMWPKELMVKGIRYPVADLNDAISLLKKDPFTRQCYIPIFFPEDLTAARMGHRVPCTFGWHFMLREDVNGVNRLHCFYPMRSCDAVRHFHNDIYFAIRLTQWLIEQAELVALPGDLHFSATSFHCFKNDKYTLEKLCQL